MSPSLVYIHLPLQWVIVLITNYSCFKGSKFLIPNLIGKEPKVFGVGEDYALLIYLIQIIQSNYFILFTSGMHQNKPPAICTF